MKLSFIEGISEYVANPLQKDLLLDFFVFYLYYLIHEPIT